jgi:septum formation protein
MLILASKSPRRRDILLELGIEFEIVESGYEEIIEPGLSPQQTVLDLAIGKGREVLLKYPNRTILSADTMVFAGGERLGKAKDKQDAFRIIKLLQGSSCEVYTAQVLWKDGEVKGKVTAGNCFFKPLTDEQIQTYLDDPEADWMDKAGAFAIQGKAKSFASFKGEWSTILGLSKEVVREWLGV